MIASEGMCYYYSLLKISALKLREAKQAVRDHTTKSSRNHLVVQVFLMLKPSLFSNTSFYLHTHDNNYSEDAIRKSSLPFYYDSTMIFSLLEVLTITNYISMAGAKQIY